MSGPAASVWVVLFRRRFGDLTWDAILRISGVLALLAIPVTLAQPHAAALTGFLLVTIWINGPLSPLLPATYEPVLMLMGRVYSPLAVAALGTAGVLFVEYINYQLYRQVLFIERLSRVREGRFVRRVVALFQRAPFFTVWLCSWSPLPYWIVRFLSPLAGYSVRRQLVATALGRFPRLWFFAALGLFWRISATALFAISAGSIVLGLGVWALRLRHPRSGATGGESTPENKEKARLTV